MNRDDVLAQLVAMSNHLGDPTRDYVILGEGNTSARIDDETFWVKASGTHLNGINRDGFVQVRFERLFELFASDDISDEAVERGLEEAKVDPGNPLRPSVETVLHAMALSLEGVNFVGHTHPTAVNALTCSVAFEKAAGKRLFPDEIVSCGPTSVVIPLTEPGLPLARRVKAGIDAYVAEWNELPKVVLMQNHGMIALGATAHEVEAITAMAVKAARVLLGTYAFGGPHFLPLEVVQRIHTRPDEQYRRRRI